MTANTFFQPYRRFVRIQVTFARQKKINDYEIAQKFIVREMDFIGRAGSLVQISISWKICRLNKIQAH